MGGAGSGKQRNNTRDRKIVRLRDQGLTLREIAQRVGVSRQAVLLALDRQGYARPPKRPGRQVPAKDPDRVTAAVRPVQCPAAQARRPGDLPVSGLRGCHHQLDRCPDPLAAVPRRPSPPRRTGPPGR